MDFELDPAEREAERGLAVLLAAEADSLAALPVLDRVARHRLVLAAQRALRAGGGAAVAPRLALARASVPLLLACEATRHLGLVAAERLPEPERTALLRGDRIGAVALSDDAASPRARLRRAGGGWRLTARKAFVTNGPDADWLAVFADADEGEAVCLLAPGDEGVGIGGPVALLGLDGLAVGSVVAEGAPVADGRVLGPAPGRERAARYAREADLTLAVAAAGLMRGVLGAANRHAHAHARDGRPSFARQEVAFELAGALALTEAAELLCHRAAWTAAAGEPGADALVRCAKVFCAESAERVASLALQVTAGEGYRRGSAAERAFRDAKGLALAGTTLEVARMAIADAQLARADIQRRP